MPSVVGVPTEVKADERRVAVTPDGVRELEAHGVDVLVQAGAGVGASLPDDAYRAAGAEVVADAAEVWARADLVCKVKEPQPEELGLPPPGASRCSPTSTSPPTPRWPTALCRRAPRPSPTRR